MCGGGLASRLLPYAIARGVGRSFFLLRLDHCFGVFHRFDRSERRVFNVRGKFDRHRIADEVHNLVPYGERGLVFGANKNLRRIERVRHFTTAWTITCKTCLPPVLSVSTCTSMGGTMCLLISRRLACCFDGADDTLHGLANVVARANVNRAAVGIGERDHVLQDAAINAVLACRL